LLVLTVGILVFLAVLAAFCGLVGLTTRNPLLALEEGVEGDGKKEEKQKRSFFARLWEIRGDSPLTLESGVFWGLVIGAAAGGLTMLLFDPFFALPVGLGVFFLGPRALNLYLTRRRIKRFRDAVEFGLDTMLAALSIGGMSLEKALREAARDAPEPIRTEFSRLAEEIAKGISETEAFRRLAQRVPCPEAEELCDAIELYTRVGGPKSLELLRTVLSNLRDSITMRYQVHQHTKGAKLSAVMVTLIPVGYLTSMLFLAPDLFGPLVNTEAGRTVAFVALLIFGFGVWLVFTILRSIEEF